MSVSVVIATYNRSRELSWTLKSLAEQTVQPSEVIVIDDGSALEHQDCIHQLMEDVSLPMVLLSNHPQKGPAAARNKGILASKSDLILFINDDTIPTNQSFLENHLNLALAFPGSAILGKMVWHPETPNGFLKGRWGARNLGFYVGCNMEEAELLAFHKFCTANILVPKKFLKGCLFDENFPHAALEDTELGYRLAQKGVPLRYNPRACVWHYHAYEPVMVARRQKQIGKSLRYLLRRHPELSAAFGPRMSRRPSRILSTIMATPLSKLLPPDLRLFLLGLSSKYKSFWG